MIGVQAFAEGGLVTGPTIALTGEDRKKEACCLLNDPEAMLRYVTALVSGVVTTHHSRNIEGLVSSDNLSKVVGKINKMVNKGQLSLTASNSLRLTKRSA